MDKIAGLKEILALDGRTALPATASPWSLPAAAKPTPRSPNSTPYWPMTLATPPAISWRRRPWPTRAANHEAIDQLKAGVASANRTGNNHAQGEMQDMLDEIGTVIRIADRWRTASPFHCRGVRCAISEPANRILNRNPEAQIGV